ncbi:hypothetical protein FRX31_030556 [Thalictrum thalictroides]|uniref:Uncharacterized protein n=1 Tax=Thalictrum thalictroides TaxID=46969 RepID=A0A7J6V4X3_THATH|nr:hypothetical protein FRX31_030556 [Thalictrum thalictroides]
MASSSSPSYSSFEIRVQEELLYQRVYDVVQRSMCHYHFDEFDVLRSGLQEFCIMVTQANDVIKEQIFDFYPFYLAKMSHELWNQFDQWLETKDGEPVRELCKPWPIYDCWTIETCSVCQFESKHPGERVVVSESDEDGGVDDDGDAGANGGGERNANGGGEVDAAEDDDGGEVVDASGPSTKADDHNGERGPKRHRL